MHLKHSPTVSALNFGLSLNPYSPMPTQVPMLSARCLRGPRDRRSLFPAAFTLIELLVVIAIIAILAGLGFAGVSGALKTARKAEVRAMANQVKLAITAYYSDYGVWPTNAANTGPAFLAMMTGASTNGNRRAIRYLEPSAKFTNSAGLVTPDRFYASGRSNFLVAIDTNYDGRIRLPGQSADSPGSVAVWVTDPDNPNKFIGTW